MSAQVPVIAGKEKQRFCTLPTEAVDTADNDVMVACLVNLVRRALEHCQAVGQKRNTALAVIEIDVVKQRVIGARKVT